MYFPDVVVTGNWLSGGNASKYPGGNRFDTPFDTGLSTVAAAAPRPDGADMAKLRPLLDTVPRGVMTGVPQPPKGLRLVISSGR
jgi:hypothetical protein